MLIQQGGLQADLVDAIRARDYRACEDLLCRGADPDAADEHGQTPLKAAIASARGAEQEWHAGITFIVDALIEAGANPDAADAEGRTALMAAAQAGCTYLISRLLRHGADPLHRDAAGHRASDLASTWGCARALLVAEAAALNFISAGAEVIVIEKPERFSNCNK